MNHFPVFLALEGRLVVICGNGAMARARLRLLARTSARLMLFAPEPEPELIAEAAEAGARLERRAVQAGDLAGAVLVYAAHGDSRDEAIAALARQARVPINAIDNLPASDFITPAMVDRDPVCVAIGTEGTAPVLARAIKADLEARLPATLGVLARAAGHFRPQAEALPQGRARRDFWTDFHFDTGPRALNDGGEAALAPALHALLARHAAGKPRPGRVDLVGAGPGDPELLTLRARRLLDEADVVVHDRLVPAPILELARREAVFIAAGKKGYGPSTSQASINATIIEHANKGARVVRLKAGDPTIFARLDEETNALDAAGIDWAVVPGITAAAAGAAALGQSLTRRARNSELRFLTAHDIEGFAEHDWHQLARPGAVAAIYMGSRAARFLQGRLLMHGADGATPVTAIENASRPDQRILPSRLDSLPADLAGAAPEGPVILFLGLAPRAATAALPDLQQEYA